MTAAVAYATVIAKLDELVAEDQYMIEYYTEIVDQDKYVGKVGAVGDATFPIEMWTMINIQCLRRPDLQLVHQAEGDLSDLGLTFDISGNFKLRQWHVNHSFTYP